MKIVDEKEFGYKCCQECAVCEYVLRSEQEQCECRLILDSEDYSLKEGVWEFNMTYRRFECSNCKCCQVYTSEYCPHCGSHNGTECEDFDDEDA